MPGKLDAAFHMLAAYWHLRRCDALGARPRVYGRPRITNLGKIRIGERFQLCNQTVPSELATYPGGRIEIGDGVFVNYGASISAHQLVRIGDACQLGSYVCLMDNDYHQVEDRSKPGDSAPIVLDRNAWLGVRVIVLRGVTIGANTVIGAGSVVTKDIPDNVMAAGVPARVIRRLNEGQT